MALIMDINQTIVGFICGLVLEEASIAPFASSTQKCLHS